jgi:hypothetical protein
MRFTGKLLWFIGKVWVGACILLVGSQLRLGEETVLKHLDHYLEKPAVAKHFAQILYPIHWTLNQVGVDVGWENVERVIAYKETNEQKIKNTFGEATGQEMEKLKKAAEAQKQALKAIEQDLAE